MSTYNDDDDEKQELIDTLLNNLANATPEELNAFTVKQQKRGGKFAILARLLRGEITPDEASLLIGRLNQ